MKHIQAQSDFTLLGTECTPIAGAQNRAITLPQLRRLCDFLQSHAAPEDGAMQWVDLAPPEYSPTSGQTLNVNTINLYQAGKLDHQQIKCHSSNVIHTGERLGHQACHKAVQVQPG